ncbi:MAG TPA: GNAT family N-acetyltransferase [Solirubrobacteraceae bacterium]|nr:GNAT family N-acetyltransferase [Solirubrobacteraceae bacterium]
MTEARALAVGLLCEIEDACAQHRISCHGGHAILDSRHRLLWDANHVRVERSTDLDPNLLIDAAEQHLGGERFRMITALHEESAEQLHDPLAARGYGTKHRRLMVLDAPPPEPDPRVDVQWVNHGEIERSRYATLTEHPEQPPEVARQLISRDLLVSTVVRERAFAVFDGGELVARCQLLGDAPLVQLEHVFTRAAHRRRGYARALVSHAARAAVAGGTAELFLLADADGWIGDFCASLGFADAGLMPRFLRLAG